MYHPASYTFFCMVVLLILSIPPSVVSFLHHLVVVFLLSHYVSPVARFLDPNSNFLVYCHLTKPYLNIFTFGYLCNFFSEFHNLLLLLMIIHLSFLLFNSTKQMFSPNFLVDSIFTVTPSSFGIKIFYSLL